MLMSLIYFNLVFRRGLTTGERCSSCKKKKKRWWAEFARFMQMPAGNIVHVRKLICNI